MTYSKNAPDADEVRRNQIIGMLFGAFGKADDAQRQAIYTKMLADVPNAVLAKAVKRLILEKTFLPSVAEIVAAARSIIAEVAPGNRLPDWQEAWAEIERAVQSSSAPEFSHPIIALTVKTYGLMNLKMCPVEMWQAAQAQVRRIYDDLCKRYSDKELNAYVIGDAQTEITAALERSGKGLVKIGVPAQTLPEGVKR